MRVTRLSTLSLGRVLFAALALALTLAVTAPAASADDRVELRIVNPERWSGVPWQAAIVNRGDARSPLGVFCGATIRDATHVITAAHCVPDSNAADLDVLTSFVSRYAPEATLQRAAVSAITSHPAYDDASKRNDLAILTLATPLALTNAGPAPTLALPVIQPGASLADQVAMISGWGTTTSGGEQPDPLLVARILLYPDAQCGGYGTGFDASVMLCAGLTTNGGITVDTCQGDSGGPLARIPNLDVQPWSVDRLVGVVSFGRGCADPQYPGVYTKLSNADLNARATAANPPPRLEPTGQPSVAGTLRAGETLTCASGGWTLPPSGTSQVWLTAALGADGRATDVRVEGEGQTLALDPGDVGRIVTCEENAVNDGGARTIQARAVGLIEAALPPAPPPAPPTPPPAPPVAIPADIVKPDASFTRRNCTRQRCRLTIKASDSGGPATSATVTYQRLTGCRRGRRGARCRRAKTIVAKAVGDGIFEVTTPRLPLARWRFTVVATDAAGNRSAPVQVALRVSRDRPRARARGRRRGRRG